MESKSCYMCLQTKPFSDFLNSSRRKDGKRGECRDCGREIKRHKKKLWTPAKRKAQHSLPSAKEARKRYKLTAKSKAAERAGQRRRNSLKYHSDPEYRARVRAKLDAAKTPEKNRARKALGKAVKEGRIKRQPCDCGNSRSEAHHEDYSKPLEVDWLCASCHQKLHHQKRMLDLDNY